MRVTTLILLTILLFSFSVMRANEIYYQVIYSTICVSLENHEVDQSILLNDTEQDKPFSPFYEDPEEPSLHHTIPVIVYVDDDWTGSVYGQTVGLGKLFGINAFDKIQDGESAVANNGKVFVYNGAYYENIIIDKSISLIGESNENTIIDGDNLGDAITVYANDVLIYSFLIKTVLYYFKSGVYINADYCNISNNKFICAHGIEIYDSKHINIHQNTFTDNQRGVYFYYNCDFCSMIDNLFYLNSGGLYGTGSNNLTIRDNIFQNMFSGAIDIKDIYNATIAGNSVFTSQSGIYIRNCDNGLINKNEITSCTGRGMLIDNSSYTTVEDNTFYDNGLDVFDSSDMFIENNIINGKPIIYLENKSGLFISGAGQVILNKCDNITIQNTSMSFHGSDIYLEYCNLINIKNCYLNDEAGGISLKWSNYCTCENNILTHNVNYEGGGISLHNSNYNTIRRNTINKYNSKGISLWPGNHCIVNNNIITGKRGPYSIGIFVSGGGNDISNNIISQNPNGIYSWLSGFNTIIENNIIDNDIGIYSDIECEDNRIYHNNLINNTDKNAYDEWENNWDYGGEGNYWDDYMGQDLNGDGIGDTPYLIPGGDNQDNYPLMEPFIMDRVFK